MDKAATNPRLVFILAVGALIAGTAAITLLGGDRTDLEAGPRAGSSERPAPGRAARHRAGSRDGARSAAVAFVRAYLRYQAGDLGAPEREALARHSTPALGGELLSAPVRIPPGSRPVRARVLEVRSTRVAVVEGRPAVVVGVGVAANAHAQLLRAVVVRRGDAWLVAGIGP